MIWRGATVEVAPIYDIPSTLLYGDSSMALSVQGAKDNISGRKFRDFCGEIGLPERATERIMVTALRVTEGVAERIISATDFDPRRARDLRRVLAKRRDLWA